ncbi:MAG: hypothetical protein ACM3S0_16265 [Acidobacteriota bacterium]
MVHEIAAGMGLHVQLVCPQDRQSCGPQRDGLEELLQQFQATGKHVLVALWDNGARKAIAASADRNSLSDVRFTFVNEH